MDIFWYPSQNSTNNIKIVDYENYYCNIMVNWVNGKTIFPFFTNHFLTSPIHRFNFSVTEIYIRTSILLKIDTR